MFVAIQLIIQCANYYCVDGSIWHFKFPKVVQAHTLGEVGILGIILSFTVCIVQQVNRIVCHMKVGQ